MVEPLPPSSLVEPEICHCAVLRQAARHVTRLYDEALAPLGLSINQYAILARLRRSGPKTIQELARLLVMDRSTLGHLLRPIAARGLVEATTSATDRRRRSLALTASGTALVAAARPLWTAAQARFENGFGTEAAATLRATLARTASIDFTPAGDP